MPPASRRCPRARGPNDDGPYPYPPPSCLRLSAVGGLSASDTPRESVHQALNEVLIVARSAHHVNRVRCLPSSHDASYHPCPNVGCLYFGRRGRRRRGLALGF